MYCLQWLIPVLLIPKPVNPAFLYNHVVFMILYLFSFFIERKPCTICSLVFLFAVILICSSGYGNCLFWNDEDNQCPLSKEDLGMYILFEKTRVCKPNSQAFDRLFWFQTDTQTLKYAFSSFLASIMNAVNLGFPVN